MSRKFLSYNDGATKFSVNDTIQYGDSNYMIWEIYCDDGDDISKARVRLEPLESYRPTIDTGYKDVLYYINVCNNKDKKFADALKDFVYTRRDELDPDAKNEFFKSFYKNEIEEER